MQYKIIGDNLPALHLKLNEGESIRTQAGAMAWMTPNMKMDTVAGGVGKFFGRIFTGDTAFQNRFTAVGGAGEIGLASNFPGAMRGFKLNPDSPIIVQKSAFLASSEGVDLSVYFQKKIMAGLFGGEGFLMQKLSGSGMAFIEIDGSAVDITLAEGESMLVDTGYLAMMDASCTMEIVDVPGIKNMVLGGEGIFHTKVTGPGRMIVQTMPLHALAWVLRPFFPTNQN